MRLLYSAVWLVLLSPGLLSAQQAVSAQQETSTLRAKANLVLLDVVVTASGRAVKGIAKDKFHVYDEGKPQTLTVFEEHDAPSGAPADAAPAGNGPATAAGTDLATNLGSDVYSNLPQLEPRSATVLLFDTLNTPLADQAYVKQEMLKYLKTLAPGTRIAIFTLGSRLRMVEGFTGDPSELARVIQAKGGDTVQLSVVLDPEMAQQEADSINALASFGADVSSLQQFLLDITSFQTDLRVEMTMDAMQQLARYLQAVAGRKNLIWFSGSFPIQITNDGSTPHAFNSIRDYSEQLRETDTMLSAARVAVYPVDARGPMLPKTALAASDYNSKSLSSALGSGSRRTRGASAPSTGGYAAQQDDRKQLTGTMNEQASMQQIAEETGGKAFLNTNDLQQAVAEATGAGDHYYTVGYVPALKPEDASYHRLKVTVDGEDGVAYRHGYFADAAAKGAGPPSELRLMRAAAEVNGPPMYDVRFKVRVVPAVDAASAAGAGAKLTRYKLDFAVPAGALAFSASAKGHRDTLEFVAVAFDAQGRRLNYIDQRSPVDVDDATYARILKSGILLHQQIDLPAGKVLLRVVVHDVDGNKAGALQVPLVVGGGG